MVRDDVVAIVKAAYNDFQTGDIPALLSRLTDDVVWETPGAGTQIPYAGRLQGKAAVGGFFQSLGATAEFHRFDTNEFITNAAGDTVVVLGEWDATVRATDVRVPGKFAMVFRLRGGKITGFYEYSDSRLLADAFAAPAKR
jgi:ketosteroid isomerase-like protein